MKENYNEPYILYENEDIILLYKPSYWSCNTAINTNKYYKYPKNNKFIILFLKFIIKILFYNKKFPFGLMNRLDIETSGAVIVAKNKLGYNNILDLLHKKKDIKKIYVCLTNYNDLINNENYIKNSIDCIKDIQIKYVSSKCFITTKNNKKYIALSYYYKIRDLIDSDGNKYSLFYVVIFTGKTHQIRIHMKNIGCPIVSDPQYLDDDLLKQNKKIINRCFLHNIYYGFNYNNENLEFIIPLQKDLLDCLNKLKSKKYDIYKIPKKLIKLKSII